MFLWIGKPNGPSAGLSPPHPFVCIELLQQTPVEPELLGHPHVRQFPPLVRAKGDDEGAMVVFEAQRKL
jgi:hypothetical protein